MYKKALIMLLSASFAITSAAQEKKSPEKPKMKFLGVFDAGQSGVSIYKLFDPSDNVVCYVLTPDAVSRKQAPEGLIYDGNSVGSISCVMVRVPVVSASPEPSQSRK